MDDSYRYEPLDLDGPALRVVRLLGGQKPEIKCELFQTWLYGDSTIPYEALSYAWGGTERSKEILVDGKRLGVTGNLNLALQHLRQDTDRLLWIDAICINQDNAKERGHQVQQMTTIYSQAERVIIWLGAATYDTNVLMDSLREWQNTVGQLPASGLKATNKWLLRSWSEILPVLKLRYLDLVARLRYGLTLLLQRSWFERVWVLQEVASARVCLFHCGSRHISSRIFALAPILLDLTPKPQSQAVLDILPGPSRDESWWYENRELYTLLLKFKQSEATDPRDMIFALHGICSDVDAIKNYADYTQSTVQMIQQYHNYFFCWPGRRYSSMSYFLQELSHIATARLTNLLLDGDGPAIDQFLQNQKGNLEITHHILGLILNNQADGQRITERLLSVPRIKFPFSAALPMACQHGHQEMVELLLSKAVDASTSVSSITDPDFKYAVLAARRHPPIIRVLLRHVQQIDHWTMDFIMDIAARDGAQDIIERLIYLGANVNALSKNSHTPLWSACRKAHVDVVQTLLKHGAHVVAHAPIPSRVGLRSLPSFPERRGDALWVASVKRHHNIVKLLLIQDGCVHSGTLSKTMLWLDVLFQDQEQEQLDAIQGLIDQGYPVDTPIGHFGTPLQLASLRGRIETVRLLLESGASINDRGKFYGTALHAASVVGYADIVQVLINAGANVNCSVEGDGGLVGTPLQAASRAGSTSTVQILLDAGADLNATCASTGNAFEEAVLGGYVLLSLLLQDRGASVWPEDAPFIGQIREAVGDSQNSSTWPTRVVSDLDSLQLQIGRRIASKAHHAQITT